jgi:hypothetical protein
MSLTDIGVGKKRFYAANAKSAFYRVSKHIYQSLQ